MQEGRKGPFKEIWFTFNVNPETNREIETGGKCIKLNGAKKIIVQRYIYGDGASTEKRERGGEDVYIFKKNGGSNDCESLAVSHYKSLLRELFLSAGDDVIPEKRIIQDYRNGTSRENDIKLDYKQRIHGK